jgi:hypothetical protein
MKKIPMMPRPKAWEGWCKGIRLGQVCCNSAHMPILLPLYIEDLLVQTTEVIPDHFGSNQTIITSNFPEDMEKCLNNEIRSMHRNMYLPSVQDDDHMMGMLSWEIVYNELISINYNKLERYFKKAYNLQVYFQADNVQFTYGKVYTIMWEIRKIILRVFKEYKPKNYKPRRREIVKTVTVSKPINVHWGKNGEPLPF